MKNYSILIGWEQCKKYYEILLILVMLRYYLIIKKMLKMLSEMLWAKGYGNVHRSPKIKQNVELNMNNRYVTWTVRKISHMNAWMLNTQALSHYILLVTVL